jgi:hypothetical protein
MEIRKIRVNLKKQIQTRREEKNVWTGKIDERNWGEIRSAVILFEK